MPNQAWEEENSPPGRDRGRPSLPDQSRPTCEIKPTTPRKSYSYHGHLRAIPHLKRDEQLATASTYLPPMLAGTGYSHLNRASNCCENAEGGAPIRGSRSLLLTPRLALPDDHFVVLDSLVLHLLPDAPQLPVSLRLGAAAVLLRIAARPLKGPR
jgi:hypothetical protein